LNLRKQRADFLVEPGPSAEKIFNTAHEFGLKDDEFDVYGYTSLDCPPPHEYSLWVHTEKSRQLDGLLAYQLCRYLPGLPRSRGIPPSNWDEIRWGGLKGMFTRGILNMTSGPFANFASIGALGMGVLVSVAGLHPTMCAFERIERLDGDYLSVEHVQRLTQAAEDAGDVWLWKLARDYASKNHHLLLDRLNDMAKERWNETDDLKRSFWGGQVRTGAKSAAGNRA